MINWIASYPKSGNTYMRMFLSAYDTGQIDINNPRNMQFDDLWLYYWQVVSPKPLGELTPPECVAMRGAVLQHMQYSNSMNIALKTHSMAGAYMDYPLIPPMMTGRSIYIMRDPRAIAVSWAEYSRKPIDEIIDLMTVEANFAKLPGLWNILGRWDTHIQTWIHLRDEFKLPILFVRYEDMVTKPHETFGTVIKHMANIDHLDVQMSDKLFAAVDATKFLNLQEQEYLFGFREHSAEHKDQGPNFFRAGSSKWNNDEKLTSRQALKISSEFQTTMLHFDYLV